MVGTSVFSESELQASADDAQAMLQGVGDRALALVEAWVTQGNAAAVQEAAEYAAGKVRTAARRGLNILKARGTPIPPRRRVVRAQPIVAEPALAWLLSPDAHGVWLLALARRQPSGSYRACLVFLADLNAVIEIQLREISQSKLFDSIRGAVRGQGYEPVKVPASWARQIVHTARLAQRDRGLIEPLGFKSAADLLEPVPAEAESHPFDEEGLALSEEDARQLSQNSAELHQLPEFRGWIPERAALQELLVKVGERFPKDQKPGEQEVMGLVREEVLAATDRYFTPERRNQLVQRLKHAALSVLHREGEARALDIAAVAEVLKHAGLITHPPREIPFLTTYFDKGLAMLMAERGGRLEIPVPATSAPRGVTAEGA